MKSPPASHPTQHTTNEAHRIAGYLVARDPLIIWGPNKPDERAGPGTSMAAAIGNRRAYFLISLSYTRENGQTVAGDAAEIDALRSHYPEHRHIILCNTRAEVAAFGDQGIPALLCSALAYVNETVFDIDPLAIKEFDAIYNATLTPVKRHELCRDVDSLGLIYHWYPYGGYPDNKVLTDHRVLLPKARFINDDNGVDRRLNNVQVAQWINRARVGLCLSEREGVMLATMEYLLCGVPVVSTPSVGGRDRVIDPTHSIIVEPDAASVARAVRMLAARRPDPAAVREAACDAMRPDRARLLHLIRAIYREEGVRMPIDAPWIEMFRHGPWPMTTVGGILAMTPIAEIQRRRQKPKQP